MVKSVSCAGVTIAVALGSAARADGVDDLVARGQELAKQAEWSQAITLFKQADAQRPRAQHACMIGLAYTRRELWAQAELYFARCHQRASDTDPLPDWLGDAEAQLAAKLAGAGIEPVSIAVEPVAAKTTISISGFEQDEVVAPGPIHLVPGRYTLDIAAPGYIAQRREIVVEPHKPQTIDIRLEAPRAQREPSNVPWVVIGGGVALAAAGLVTDLWKVGPLRTSLETASYDDYPKYTGSFDRWRGITVGLWATGAVVAGVGAYLLYRERTTLTVVPQLEPHGAGVVIEWRR
jgi:hypothetical protein